MRAGTTLTGFAKGATQLDKFTSVVGLATLDVPYHATALLLVKHLAEGVRVQREIQDDFGCPLAEISLRAAIALDGRQLT